MVIAKPLTVAALEAELGRCDYILLQAKREKNALRTKIPGLMTTGDMAEVEVCRAEMATLDAQIVSLTERRAQTQEAIGSLKARDLAAFEANRLRHLEKLAAAMVNASAALEALTTQWAEARGAAREAAVEFETELSRCRVSYDAFLSVATRLDGRAEMLLWAMTDGAYGRSRTLDTPSQLRASGQASLKAAAREFRGVTLRSARQTLGFSGQPDEAT